jgi:curved DNA-binding protein
MEFKDYYKVLGVAPEADLKEIKTAYRRLARKYHPDVSQEDNAEEHFKAASEAYEVLKDTQKRAEYDELRTYGGQQGQRFTPPPEWNGSESVHSGGDFSDFFESLFGARGQQQGPGFGARPSPRGQDMEMELPILLEDTLSDESKKIHFSRPHFDDQGIRQKDVSKTLNIKIPKGVSDGEKIRLKGQGAAGIRGGANGDLYLHIRLVPHPLFDVEGHNLVITVPIAPWEAVMGAKVQIPTLTGKIQLTIPANSQTGQRLRIKGKGLIGKLATGDLYAVFKVVMPAKTDDQSRALWEQLAEKSAFDPRNEWSTSL